MADISPNGQDLAKALGSMSGSSETAAQAFNANAAVASPGADAAQPQATPADPSYPPIIPANSPIAPSQMQASASQPQATANTQAAAAEAPAAPSGAYAYPGQDTAAAAPGTSASLADSAPVDPAAGGPLESIKKEALDQLRPLVDKLGVEPQEKFDTYLLLLRSTDDSNLIAPAYEAAKAIPDESQRAEALLNIIKEIDYLTHQKHS